VSASLEPGSQRIGRWRGKRGFIPASCMAGGGSWGVRPRIGFAPVRIAPDAAPAGVVDRGTIEIEFATGARMRITGAVDAAAADGRGCRTGRKSAAMIPIAWGVRVWIATGHTDMRRGMNTLALTVQEALKRDPHGGDLYVFRGKSGKLIKILWHDGLGMSLYAKRLERGRFVWPPGFGRRGGDHGGTAWLHARRHRLAQSTSQLAAIGGGLSAVVESCAEDQRNQRGL